MKITEKEMVHKALRCCRDGNSCSRCPYRSNDDCVAILEHLATEIYVADHPEIFNRRIVKKDDKVEIVRCKDCTCFEGGTDVGFCWCHDSKMHDYDYCSLARREVEVE